MLGQGRAELRNAQRELRQAPEDLGAVEKLYRCRFQYRWFGQVLQLVRELERNLAGTG
jgi:hypothetical protein